MCGMCGTRVLMLGGSHLDKKVEGDGGPRGRLWSRTIGGGVQGMLGHEAEMLPAGVVKGTGRCEALIKEKEGRGRAGRGRHGR